MTIIDYIAGFYGPENVTRDGSGQVCVFIDRTTSSGVSIPSRYRNLLRKYPSDWEGPFLMHLGEIATGYGEQIIVKHHKADKSKLV